MADDTTGEMESIIQPEAEKTAPEHISDWPTDFGGGGGEGDTPAGGEAPGSIGDFMEHKPQGGSMPTPEDMLSTNASNAEARAQAIKDGMDEGTADILHPNFSTPEDMNQIN